MFLAWVRCFWLFLAWVRCFWLWFLVVVVVFVLKGVVGRGWVRGLGLGWVVGDGVGVVVVVFGCDRCFWGWFLVVFGLGPVFLVVVF